MIRTFFAIPFLYVYISFSMNAQDFPSSEGISPEQGLFGIGVILGEPFGLSGKYWISHDRAFDMALGASVLTNFRVHATYLRHVDAFDNQRFPLYYGAGVSIAGRSARIASFGGASDESRDKFGLGIRGAVGVTYLTPKAPFDIFFEIGGIFIIFPPTGLDLDFSIGGRYYF